MDESRKNGFDETARGFEKQLSQCWRGSFWRCAGLSGSSPNKGTNLKMMNRRISETRASPLRTLAAATEVLLETLSFCI